MLERIKNIPITVGYILRRIRYTRINKSQKNRWNINHYRKLVFVHIPKTAGTSIKAVVIPCHTINQTHVTPTRLVSKTVWNNYTTFCVVRNPFDKFISSYFYHTSEQYMGSLFRKNPNIHNFSIDEYCVLYSCITEQQINYIKHKHSKKPIDYILRFENLEHDFNSFCKKNNIDAKLPHKNKSNRGVGYRQYYSPELKDKVAKFSQPDLEYFGYKW